MTTPENDRDGLFMRSAAAVGDLSSPFYDEERQRDVWNEASAVGFQTMLVLGLIAAGAMFWIGGEAAVPYGLTTVGFVGVASAVTIGYARRLGVDAEQVQRIGRARMVAYGILVLLLLAGMIRATAGADGFTGGTAWGAAAGAGIALACLAVSAMRARRA